MHPPDNCQRHHNYIVEKCPKQVLANFAKRRFAEPDGVHDAAEFAANERHIAGFDGNIRRALACDAETRRALSTAAARIVRPATWDLTVPVLADRLRMLAATPAGMGTR